MTSNAPGNKSTYEEPSSGLHVGRNASKKNSARHRLSCLLRAATSFFCSSTCWRASVSSSSVSFSWRRMCRHEPHSSTSGSSFNCANESSSVQFTFPRPLGQVSTTDLFAGAGRQPQVPIQQVDDDDVGRRLGRALRRFHGVHKRFFLLMKKTSL